MKNTQIANLWLRLHKTYNINKTTTTTNSIPLTNIQIIYHIRWQVNQQKEKKIIIRKYKIWKNIWKRLTRIIKEKAMIKNRKINGLEIWKKMMKQRINKIKMKRNNMVSRNSSRGLDKTRIRWKFNQILIRILNLLIKPTSSRILLSSNPYKSSNKQYQLYQANTTNTCPSTKNSTPKSTNSN
jgi:hypothetical protein